MRFKAATNGAQRRGWRSGTKTGGPKGNPNGPREEAGGTVNNRGDLKNPKVTQRRGWGNGNQQM